MARDTIPPQSNRESARKLQIARQTAKDAIQTLRTAGLVKKSDPPPPPSKGGDNETTSR